MALNLAETTASLPTEWGTDLLVASSGDVAAMSIDGADAGLVIGGETCVWLS